MRSAAVISPRRPNPVLLRCLLWANDGGMAEWSMAVVLKTTVLEIQQSDHNRSRLYALT
jgi:hypothetical protein